ncbi:ATP-binding cassette sub- G member 5 [Lunasporangiospora selenospora]|uniref:ATP-binding cassette sub- G member 5 n=1 Tax=Lunasporangiospora selenospora TaxID=979761 RepID=A0A9P6KHJ2_9FUNG|nr:ATP-binding cassette sub- G member 5 [Lunasporangiospora selenospora]
MVTHFHYTKSRERLGICIKKINYCRFSQTSKDEKIRIVNELLQQLGLTACADTRVGEANASEMTQENTRGISGGERRRLSMAIQLLANPRLLFCDEVTSGLDAHSALKIVQVLKDYAESSGSTVVLSIHQPRPEIYQLLSGVGNLVLLSFGRVVYDGPMAEALPWMESLGYERCPAHMNPLDYLLDLTTIDYSSAATERLSRKRCANIGASWEERSCRSSSTKHLTTIHLNNTGMAAEPLSTLSTLLASSSQIVTYSNTSDRPAPNSSLGILQCHGTKRPGLSAQISTLIRRGWKNEIRSNIAVALFILSVMLGIILGFLFSGLAIRFQDISSISSMCFMTVVAQPAIILFMGIMSESRTIPVFEQEYKEALYSPLVYLISDIVVFAPAVLFSGFGQLNRS